MPPVIHDSYSGEIVHLSYRGKVWHVSLSGDQERACCLETGDQVTGTSRQECLALMRAKLAESLPVSGCRGSCG